MCVPHFTWHVQCGKLNWNGCCENVIDPFSSIKNIHDDKWNFVTDDLCKWTTMSAHVWIHICVEYGRIIKMYRKPSEMSLAARVKKYNRKRRKSLQLQFDKQKRLKNIKIFFWDYYRYGRWRFSLLSNYLYYHWRLK